MASLSLEQTLNVDRAASLLILPDSLSALILPPPPPSKTPWTLVILPVSDIIIKALQQSPFYTQNEAKDRQ